MGRSILIPKYRKHRACGRAIVTLNGKDIYPGVYGSTASKQEYDRIVGEWPINGRTPKQPVESITIAEPVSEIRSRILRQERSDHNGVCNVFQETMTSCQR